MVAIYRLTEDGFENVSRQARNREALPVGRYLVASVRLAPPGGWFAGKYYVDLLHPGVTEKFIEITMDAYRREIGEQFGRRVPGWFTDEPHLTPAGGIHWSLRLPEDFQARWKYDLIDHLPSLVRPVGDWKRVRHNYQQLLLEQFIERWAKPCYEYCEKNGLEFTGHYWEHGWPDASHGGDNMAMYAWHQRPAIDTLMNEYSTDVHAQFGNARAVKELASVANQLGRKRTLCEAYGAGGWDLRFEDMKRIGDWLYVLGVNTLNEHLSYVTIRGARKRDHPQSFSYHAPWWEGYHTMADYFTRLSLALSAGEQVNHVLLLEPTTSAWMYQPGPSSREQLAALGDAFQDMVNRLEKSQAEYDIGCEDIIGRHGGADGSWLQIGQRRYDIVVLPPQTENLNATTVTLLKEYLDAGGTVICCGPPPTRVDGQANPTVEELARSSHWRRVGVEDAVATMRAASTDGLKIQRTEDEQGELFHHRRRLNDGQLLFLVNTDIHQPCSGVIESTARGMEQWNAHTGSISPYRFAETPDGVQAKFTLPPCGSLLLFLSDESREPATATMGPMAIVQPIGPPTIRRLEPNVLTLDYVDVTAGGESLRNAYFYAAQRLAFVENGMQGNPWDSAVQFRDELITKEFPPTSGFEATYRFTIRDRVPKSLVIVIERPDLYRITCNGKPVAPIAGKWWLDRSFGQLDLSQAARVGENTVTIHASPMTIYHELEPAYVLGDFSLQPTVSGFAIEPPKPIELVHIDSRANNERPTGRRLEPTGTSVLRGGCRVHRELRDFRNSFGFLFCVARQLVRQCGQGKSEWPARRLHCSSALATRGDAVDQARQQYGGSRGDRHVKKHTWPPSRRPGSWPSLAQYVSRGPQNRPTTWRAIPHDRLRTVRTVCVEARRYSHVRPSLRVETSLPKSGG